MAAETRPPAPRRADYRRFQPVQTRWHDNDAFGHANNVVYYAWFDTAVTLWLHAGGHVDVAGTEVVGVVAETGCRYHAPVAFPDALEVGMRADRVGRTSVRYGLAVFRAGEDAARASGHFVHVYVDRATMRSPRPLGEAFRAALARDLAAPGAAAG